MTTTETTLDSIANSPESRRWARNQEEFFAPAGPHDQIAQRLTASLGSLPTFVKGESVTVRVKGQILPATVRKAYGQLVEVTTVDGAKAIVMVWSVRKA